MKKLFLFFVILVFLFFTQVLSQPNEEAAQPGCEFTMGAGARAAGMGNAYVAVCDEPTASYWNPAGLTQIKRSQITNMGSSMTEDRKYNVFAGTIPLPSGDTAGISYIKIGLDNIIYRDENAVIIGSGNFSAKMYIFSYGKIITPNISLGLSLKRYKNDISAQSSASGEGFDIGILYNHKINIEYVDKLTFGVVIQDIAGKRKWTTGREEKYKTNYKIGTASYGMDGALLLSFDYDKTTKFHMGLEYWLIGRIALRVGSDAGKLTAGAGFKLLNYQVDYAFLQDKKGLGDTQRISVLYSF